MSDQLKPTMTRDKSRSLARRQRDSALARAANAAPTQPKPTGDWTEGHDGTGKFGIYHGNETKKGWSGKGRLLVDGLQESQAKAIADAHNAALAEATDAAVQEMLLVKQQLDAERERYKQLEIHADFADEQLRQLREEMASIQQLANIGKQL